MNQLKKVWAHYKAKPASVSSHFAWGGLLVFLAHSPDNPKPLALAVAVLAAVVWEWGSWYVTRTFMAKPWGVSLLDVIPFLLGALLALWVI